MAIDEESLRELREITLWQQLKRQLIGLQDQGYPIREQNLIDFQAFCFNRNLFYEITSDPLLDELPLALITDFSDVSFVTFQTPTWTNSIARLLKGTVALDLELAAAKTFEKMIAYEKDFFTGESPAADAAGEDDDEELYAVVQQYNELMEQQGRDLSVILRKLYELKGAALAQLTEAYDAGNYVAQDGSLFGIDFTKSPHRKSVLSLYDDFCVKALEIISPLTIATVAIKDMGLGAFFNDIKSRSALKKSISDFIDHERNIQGRQSRLLNDFHKKVLTRHHARDLYMINACETSPFAFLAEPFPVV
jgi:hypothetical protein